MASIKGTNASSSSGLVTASSSIEGGNGGGREHSGKMQRLKRSKKENHEQGEVCSGSEERIEGDDVDMEGSPAKKRKSRHSTTEKTSSPSLTQDTQSETSIAENGNNADGWESAAARPAAEETVLVGTITVREGEGVIRPDDHHAGSSAGLPETLVSSSSSSATMSSTYSSPSSSSSSSSALLPSSSLDVDPRASTSLSKSLMASDQRSHSINSVDFDPLPDSSTTLAAAVSSPTTTLTKIPSSLSIDVDMDLIHPTTSTATNTNRDSIPILTSQSYPSVLTIADADANLHVEPIPGSSANLADKLIATLQPESEYTLTNLEMHVQPHQPQQQELFHPSFDHSTHQEHDHLDLNMDVDLHVDSYVTESQQQMVLEQFCASSCSVPSFSAGSSPSTATDFGITRHLSTSIADVDGGNSVTVADVLTITPTATVSTPESILSSFSPAPPPSTLPSLATLSNLISAASITVTETASSPALPLPLHTSISTTPTNSSTTAIESSIPISDAITIAVGTSPAEEVAATDTVPGQAEQEASFDLNDLDLTALLPPDVSAELSQQILRGLLGSVLGDHGEEHSLDQHHFVGQDSQAEQQHQQFTHDMISNSILPVTIDQSEVDGASKEISSEILQNLKDLESVVTTSMGSGLSLEPEFSPHMCHLPPQQEQFHSSHFPGDQSLEQGQPQHQKQGSVLDVQQNVDDATAAAAASISPEVAQAVAALSMLIPGGAGSLGFTCKFSVACVWFVFKVT
jgi:hypothetical protein